MSTEADVVAQLEQMGNPPAEPAAEPVAAVAAEPPPEPAPSPAPEPAKPLSLKDDDLIEVVVDGKPVQMAWKDARGGFMRNADYTRKTQEAARLRTEAESLQEQVSQAKQTLQQREAQINEVLGNPEKVAAWYQMLLANRQQAGQPPAQAQAGAQADLAQLQEQILAQTQERIEKATEELEVRQLAANYVQELSKATDALKDEYPQLKAVRGIDRILREEVQQMKPSSIQEAKTMLTAAAKAQAEELDSHFTERQKKAAAGKTQATGIEPPGGKGVLPAPKKYKGPDDPAFEQDLTQQIQKLMDAG